METIVCSACGAIKQVALDALSSWLGKRHTAKLCSRPRGSGKQPGIWTKIDDDGYEQDEE